MGLFQDQIAALEVVGPNQQAYWGIPIRLNLH